MRTALVCGAGGFIGSHIAERLKEEGYWIRGVDLKHPEFSDTVCDDFILGDLRRQDLCERVFRNNKGIIKYDEVYQLAADMGGAGYVFTGDNDADIMHNSALINLNIIEGCRKYRAGRVFYSSSACIYPQHNQQDPSSPECSEESAYPADPDSEYGWEKLFSERLYKSFERNYGLPVRIARLHNIFGPRGTWKGGKEKAPAAICRKVAQVEEGGTIDIWGKGDQTRSFLYIDECVEGISRLMRSDCKDIVNIGSEEMISINSLAVMTIEISGKDISIRNVPGPEGVRGRNSNNDLIKEKLQWSPNYPLRAGMEKTYKWISSRVSRAVSNQDSSEHIKYV